MKIGRTTYSQEEAAHIEDVKEQIVSLHSEIDCRYNALLRFFESREKSVDEPFLFDYIYNDIKLEIDNEKG